MTFNPTIRCKLCSKLLNAVGEKDNALDHISFEHGSELVQLIITNFYSFIPEEGQGQKQNQ